MRTPRADESLLIEPSPSALPVLLRENQRRIAALDEQFLRHGLQELRITARREIFQAAREVTKHLNDWLQTDPTHTNIELDQETDLVAKPWFVSGHQPELFHPGVLAKTVVVNRLARQHCGVALNLIVDNDLCESAEIIVPTGSLESPAFSRIPLDGPQSIRPWEERWLQNAASWNSFPQRMADELRGWDWNPVVEEFWPQVRTSQGVPIHSLAKLVTVVRRRWEFSRGINNWEVPMSWVCRTDSFRRFAIHLLERHAEFVPIYNDEVQQYRQRNRIRSRSHPVPELQITPDGWYEAPFWIWPNLGTERDRPFVRIDRDSVVLRDSRTELIRWPRGDTATGIARLKEHFHQKIRFRTRALTTTLFARLFLADLFVHGIGGAKYDEMTDRIAARFYGGSPPGYLTVTATLHLPFANSEPLTGPDRSRTRWSLRDVIKNPERHLNEEQSASRRTELNEIHTLQEQLRGMLSKSERLTAKRRLRELRVLLQPETETLRSEFRQRLHRWDQQAAANRILQSREFSFTLFPAEKLTRLVALIDSALSILPASTSSTSESLPHA